MTNSQNPILTLNKNLFIKRKHFRKISRYLIPRFTVIPLSSSPSNLISFGFGDSDGIYKVHWDSTKAESTNRDLAAVFDAYNCFGEVSVNFGKEEDVFQMFEKYDIIILCY